VNFLKELLVLTQMDQILFVEDYLENEKRIAKVMADLEPLLRRREEMEKLWPQVSHIRGPTIHQSNFKLKKFRTGWGKPDETLVEVEGPPISKKTKRPPPTPESQKEEEARRKLDQLSLRTKEKGTSSPSVSTSEKSLDTTQDFSSPNK
jgi:hypothetical protein